jgi:imidazole glycerol phosphate synthase glutamine amidotransferase subunit
MSLGTIGVVDYGMGNHASIVNTLRDIGFRVRVSKEPAELDLVNALVLPGVGGFPAGMNALHERGLVAYLQEQARLERPIVGICLGMQLLGSASNEYKYTVGLDLIPGEIVPFADHGWHIGWNKLECVGSDPLLTSCDGCEFYFNHSFCYQGPAEYQVAVARHPSAFAAVIRRGSIVGIQFHPEKSQEKGRELLKNLITGLVHA